MFTLYEQSTSAVCFSRDERTYPLLLTAAEVDALLSDLDTLCKPN